MNSRRARVSRVAFAAALALAYAPARVVAAEGEKALLVRAGTVIPVEGEPIRGGAVLCRDGKVVAVGKADAVPAGDAEVLDFGDRAVILPGLVAASSGLAAPGAGGPVSVAPEVRALDGFDFFRPQRRLLEGGVTTAYLDAGRRRVIGGQAAVVKLAGESPASRTLKGRAGLFGAVGDPAKNPPGLFDAPMSPDPVAHPLLPIRPQSPASRMAALEMLREALLGSKDASAPGADAVAAVASGNEPLRLQAEDAGDIDAAILLAGEGKLRLVLQGARDAHLVADRIARSKTAVVLESPFVPGRIDDPWDPREAELRAAAMGNPAALAKLDVPFAISARDAALPDLLSVAAAHVRPGFAPDRAIRAITLDAARILGVESRVGSLAPGKDADLVVLSGDPLDLRSVALLTVVEGKVAWRRDAEPALLVIRAGAVHTGTGEVYAPGAVSIENGKVVEAGPVVGVPPGATVLDRPNDVVLPGLIDAHSRMGLRSGGGNPAGTLTTAAPVSSAVVPDDPSFAAALGAGITTTLVSPGGGGTVVGTASVLKTAGSAMPERVLRENAGVEVSLAGAADLPAALQALRDQVKSAQQYHDSWEKYDKDVKEYEKAKKEYEAAKKKREEDDRKAKDARDAKEAKKTEKPDSPKAPAEEKKDEKKEEKKEEAKPELVEPKEPAKPGPNPAMEPWRDVFRKKLPVLCRAASAPEVSGALKVIKEESKLLLVVVQGDDAWRVAADLKKAETGVLLGPRVVSVVDGKTVNGARALAAAGVPFGFASDAGAGARDLPMLAAWAVRHGLGPTAAVKALTLDAARLLGVADRVGSLEAGKDADLVILSGDPFATDTRVKAVYVGGKAVLGE